MGIFCFVMISSETIKRLGEADKQVLLGGMFVAVNHEIPIDLREDYERALNPFGLRLVRIIRARKRHLQCDQWKRWERRDKVPLEDYAFHLGEGICSDLVTDLRYPLNSSDALIKMKEQDMPLV